MYTLIVSMQVRPDKREQFLAAIAENAEASVRDEPGCLRFDVVEDAQQPNRFYFYEIYRDAAAFAAHKAAPHFAEWRQGRRGWWCPAARSTPSATWSSPIAPRCRHEPEPATAHPPSPIEGQPMSSTIVTVNPPPAPSWPRYPVMTRSRSTPHWTGPRPRSGPGPGWISRCAPRSCALPPGCCGTATTSWPCWSPGRWASRWPKPAPRCTSARTGWSSTPSTRTRFLADEVYETAADRSWVSYEPVGVVLAVMPWNFPLWQVFRFAAPALMAGNAALLKHSPNTTGAALACQDILTRRRAARRVVHRAAGRRTRRARGHRAADRRPPGRGGHHHRQRAGRQRGRRDRRAGDQEVGAGAGRVGPVRGAGRRRSAAGRAPGGAGPVPQRRAELHLPEAVHRRGGRSPKSSPRW